MKHSKLLAAMVALASLVLAGCAGVVLPGQGNEPIRESVSFEGGKIGVRQQIILVPADRAEATIEWQLAATSGVTFADNGIVIEGEVVFPSETVPEAKGRQALDTASLRINPQRRSGFVCSRQADGLKFSCSTKQLDGGIYKYTIRVQTKDGGQILKVDPPIIIMKRPPGG